MNSANAIINEVKKAIVGKDEVVRKVLTVILAGGHILLEDVPGVGKTTMALAFSKSMGLESRRIQFTPDTMASDITGFSIFNKGSGRLEFQKGAVFCNLLLADEINRTSAKTQSALLEVMEEHRVTIDGVTHELPEPFICIATQNPTGSAGTQNLPESQLDRFMARLSMGYPTLENQIEIIKSRQAHDPLEDILPVADVPGLLAMRAQVSAVYARDEVLSYCARLCEATRSHEAVEQGVSPRAVLALVQMARATAWLDGRDFMQPEDVKAVFADVCAHRVRLKPYAKIKNTGAVSVLESILASVEASTVA